jgi:lysyl-tRNA synthetase class 1
MSDEIPQLVTPTWIRPVLLEFEGKGFFDEMDLCGRIGRALNDNRAAPEAERKAAFAEYSAFGFRPQDLDEKSRWDTHFGEHYSHGEFIEPDIASIDASVLAYWRHRMGESSHPTLKARYADLLWDLSKAAGAAKPPFDAAQVAADSYRRIGPLVAEDLQVLTAFDRISRALQIASQIRDQAGRIDAARDALFALAERFDHTAHWVNLFDVFAFFSKVQLTAEQRDRITAGLERHVAEVSALTEGVEPGATLHVAGRLASYYRTVGREEDARRVVHASGQAVERAAEAASSAAQGHGWLDIVYGFYREAGLKEDARRAILASRRKGEQAQSEMARTTTTYEFSEEEIAALQAAFDQATSGTLEQSLRNLVGPFVPDVDGLRQQLAERARQSPIFNIFSTARVSEGQVVGRSGPPGVDPDGALITYLAEQINLGGFHLAWMIDHVRRKFDVTAEALAEHLYGSLVFAAHFRSLITEGLDAYLKGDHLKAISVLVPQIENSLRRFLHLLGEPPNKSRRGDPSVMTEKTLSDILEHEPRIMGYFKERIVLYLLTFLADGRGQNLRNRISHGLMRAEEFHRGYSDRVLHILLLLAAVQPAEKQHEQPQGEDTGTD